MLTYKMQVEVRLDGKHVGLITCDDQGFWSYTPKGSKESGGKFKSLESCKKSLED